MAQILQSIDPEKTFMRSPPSDGDDDEEPIERSQQPAEQVEETGGAEEVDLTVRGTPRKRNMTPKQIETVKANGQKRRELALQKKEAERVLLEQIKAEEEEKLKKKLRQKAKAEIAASVPEPAAPKRRPATISLQTPSVVSARAAEPAKPKALSMQDYLRQFGL